MSIAYTLIIFLFGFVLVNLILTEHKDRKTGYGLWLFHVLISVYFCFFVFGDNIGYWRAGKQLDWSSAIVLLFEAKGTYFMHGFNYFFSGFLGMDYLSNTLFYGMLGFWGLLYFYRIAIELVPFNSRFQNFRLFPLLFYLPMLHFWSSAIGKDTLLFWAIGMFAYGLLNIPKRFLLIAFGFAFAYLVRPHIALLMAVAFGTAYILDGRTAIWKRIFLGTAMLAGAVALLPMVMEYVKLEEVSVESIAGYSDNKAGALSRSHTGSSVDISSYPPPLKWFTFLFRPLFFDINGVPALVASFENLFLLLIFFKVLGNKPVLAFRKAPFVIKGLTLFLILGTVLMSGALGNLGVMIRMRNMFLPGMMIYFMWVLSYAQQGKSVHRS
ncbi:hypothetical protein [Sphingobacterium lumbrici]|uniref:hypothetical protein n=1 Tax=Sphingobacterium lumbrici TaxID=2559600 RepID=UPI00112C044F|nr:hypothetical protein [Sphingobacterium lumbrici]